MKKICKLIAAAAIPLVLICAAVAPLALICAPVSADPGYYEQYDPPGAVSIVASYEQPISANAAICRDIGVLLGGEDGVDAKYLADFTTRMQAVHITARLIGLEEIGIEYGGVENFGDADLVEYESGLRLLAYMRKRPELGWQGDQEGNINPKGYMTVQAMYKVLLTTLGYIVDEDFLWEDTIAFAGTKGMKAFSTKRGYLSNDNLATTLVETLKTRMKDSEETLCEYLVRSGVINEGAAYKASMLPGSPGYAPLLTYKDGGPLLLRVELDAVQKKLHIIFNTSLNPTYAKALKNYEYYLPGTGYMPLPGRCQTSMSGENTIVIQFPREGWLAIDDSVGTDAFYSYISTSRRNELRVSGLYDVDGAPLPDLYIDVPASSP